MIDRKKRKKRVGLKSIIALVVLLTFLPVKAKTSHAWMSMPAAQYEVMLTEIYDQIKGILVNTLKQQAAKTLSQEINNLIGGGSSGEAMIITDWEDYLIKQPEKKAKSYINDYLSEITVGRGSSNNYLPSMGKAGTSEGFGTVMGGNYMANLKQNILKSIDEDKKPKVTFEGNSANLFAGNDVKQLESYLSANNNAWGLEADAFYRYQKKKEEEQLQKQIKGIANQGVKSKGEGDGTTKDQITMPGSIIKDMYVNIEDIPNKILASATRPAEVVSSLCSSIINKAISKGIGQVKKYVNQATSEVDSKINQAVGSDVGQYYKYLNTMR